MVGELKGSVNEIEQTMKTLNDAINSNLSFSQRERNLSTVLATSFTGKLISNFLQ
jgi:hypothetical protein